MRYLGLDYGTRRIGVALADSLTHVAVPRGIIKKDARVFDAIGMLCKQEEVSAVILGLPLTLRGEEGEMAREARNFGQQLSARLGVAVEFIDERLSSSGLRSRDVQSVDAAAAAIILQVWLDRHRKEKKQDRENSESALE